MQSLKTLSTQLAIVLALATPTSAFGQNLFGLKVGQSFFETNQPVTLKNFEAGSECEPVVLNEIKHQRFSELEFGPKPDAFSSVIHDEVELLLARQMLELCAMRTQAFQLPPSLDLSKSDLLIARWGDSFLFTGLATVSPKTKPEFCGYYLELIWASNEFQLRLCLNLLPARRCDFIRNRKALLIDTIPLKAKLSDLNLVLVPKATQGQFQFQVTISKAGKISLGAVPRVPFLSNAILATDDGVTPTKYRSINKLQLFIAVSKSAVEVERARCAYPNQARTDNPSLKPVSTSDRLGNSFEPTQANSLRPTKMPTAIARRPMLPRGQR